MAYFLRNGNSFTVTDEANVDLHTELPVGNYIIKSDAFGNLLLEQINSFDAPQKIYGNTMQNADRIMNTFLSRSASTGVMLNGEKGSGKTLLAKMLSIIGEKKNVPTIVINSPWHGDKFNTLIQSIEQSCIVLFDEFEKVYSPEQQESILTLLDGVFPSKKLFILTCNDKWQVDKHMRNRPGRIFYLLDFNGLDLDFIREYCTDNLLNQEYTQNVCQLSALFSEFNFDILKALVEEMNRYGETPAEAIKLLNAKPEFSDNKKYDVVISVDGSKCRSYQNTWQGNPLQGTLSFEYYTAVSNNSFEDDSYRTVEFRLQDLKKVDADAGSFVFARENAVVTLTKIKETPFDYKAF